MLNRKIIVCPSCGDTVLGIRDQESFIRNRILKFKKDGTPYAICKGSMGAGHPCKAEITIPKHFMFEFMKEGVPVVA